MSKVDNTLKSNVKKVFKKMGGGSGYSIQTAIEKVIRQEKLNTWESRNLIDAAKTQARKRKLLTKKQLANIFVPVEEDNGQAPKFH